MITTPNESSHTQVVAPAREYLIGLGHEVADLGPETADRVDYPDFGYKLAAVVADGTVHYLGQPVFVVAAASGAGTSLSLGTR